jgi:YbbR domain-containing protein
MPLRSLILDHFWLKLFALILASLIWLTVRANLGPAAGETTRTFANRPILLLTDSAEHVAMVANPSRASVTVQGSAALLRELSEHDIHVYVRLNEQRQAGGELPVHAHTPPGAIVVLVAPATTAVRPADAP